MSSERIVPPTPDGSGDGYRNNKGTAVGRVGPDGYLQKHGLCYQRHHLHSYGGWATEARHIDQLAANGGRGVRLHLEDGRVLESSLLDWQHHAYGPTGLSSDQLVLPDKFWRPVHAGHQLALLN